MQEKWQAECRCPERTKGSKFHQKGCYKRDHGARDCGGLAHFMCTGANGNINQIAEGHKDSKITIMEGVKNQVPPHHKPYTIYALLAEGYSGFNFVHYFTYLDHGEYISRTGGYPVSIFESFGDMVKKDGFPAGMPTKESAKRSDKTDDIAEAYIADRIVCGPDDMVFTKQELETLRSKLSRTEIEYFESKIKNPSGF